jgi:hypothetical protein
MVIDDIIPYLRKISVPYEMAPMQHLYLNPTLAYTCIAFVRIPCRRW